MYDPAAPREHVQLLEWDSRHFGFPVGSLNALRLSECQVKGQLSHAKQFGLRLVYCFRAGDQFFSNTLLDNSGGVLVARRAKFVGDVGELLHNTASETGTPVEVREFPCASATTALLALGISAGRYSRFRRDSRIPRDRFEQLYCQWVDRSTRRELADAVFVAETSHNSTDGFVTVGRKYDQGAIGLIAVTERAHGTGLGKHLMGAAHHWLLCRGIRSVTVVTQLENEAACRLYRRMGYQLTSVQPMYHFWLNAHDD